MNTSKQELLRKLPSVDEVLNASAMQDPCNLMPRDLVVECVRKTIEEVRCGVVSGEAENAEGFDDVKAHIISKAQDKIYSYLKPSLRPVINATGIVIHTNLGRSILADDAVNAVLDVARNFSTLEYDAATLKRGSRHMHLEKLVCALTGAEGAVVVNNNAAAVFLVLSEFAKGHSAVVSRGEMVEIGGSFRIPDIMELSGADMYEIGTTNKTHLSDYECAIDDTTSMLLKVHPSNYRMVGFTEATSLSELRQLADDVNAEREAAFTPDEHAVPTRAKKGEGPLPLLVYEDQGSGAFLKLDCFGQYSEPTVLQSIKDGADLISFSGDKLLGGAQAGIIIGKANLIERLKKNPMMRVLRPDKMTLAAMEATLRLYLNTEEALVKIPTLRMLSETQESVRARAEMLAASIAEAAAGAPMSVEVVDEVSHSGGGALPACDIPSAAVRITFDRGCAQDCEYYLANRNTIPVIARIKKEALLLDARTVQESEIALVAQAVASYFSSIDRQEEGHE